MGIPCVLCASVVNSASRLRTIFRLAVYAFVCAVLTTTTQAAADTVIVYRGVTVIDGTGAAPKPHMAIVTRGERIEAVVPDAPAAQFGRGAAERNTRGLYAIPGLIDS